MKSEDTRETQRERDEDIERGSTDPKIPPIGAQIDESPVIRHVRCDSRAPGVTGFHCMRERGHDGAHSIGILNTDRAYVWPRTLDKVSFRDRSGPQRETIVLDDPNTRPA